MHVGLKNSYTITLDDDPTVQPLIEKTLGIKSLSFLSLDALMKEVTRHRPIALFVDIHLSQNSTGLEAIPLLKKRWPYCAIIVVTSDPTEAALTEALASGADDFIQKPIRPGELSARLQTRLSEVAKRSNDAKVRVGDITLDSNLGILSGNGTELHLSPTCIAAFMTLIRAKGAVVSRESLMRKGWGKFVVSNNCIDRKIFELRKALKETSKVLEIKAAYGDGFFVFSKSKQDLQVVNDNVSSKEGANDLRE